jgi:hAT family C-terminal dimerisation region
MDILPIQASSVPCERVFSSSKQTITARRSQLNPQLVEALQLIKFEAKQVRELTFTIGLDKDDEVRELEEIAAAEPTQELTSESYLHNVQE